METKYFASLLKKATSPSSLAERSVAQATGNYDGLFGNVVIPWPVDKENMTMAAAATLEWSVVEALLQKATRAAA